MVTLDEIKQNCQMILKKSSISSKELVYLLDGREKGAINFTLIDIREPKEHRNFSIDGTDILFPVSKMHLYPEILEQLRHENYVTYCATGEKSAHMIKIAQKMGFSQSSRLDGGIISYHGKTLKNTATPNIF